MARPEPPIWRLVAMAQLGGPQESAGTSDCGHRARLRKRKHRGVGLDGKRAGFRSGQAGADRRARLAEQVRCAISPTQGDQP